MTTPTPQPEFSDSLEYPEYIPLKHEIEKPTPFKVYSNEYFKPNRSGRGQLVSSCVFYLTNRGIWHYGQYNYEKDTWSIHDGQSSKICFHDGQVESWFYPPDHIFVEKGK